MCAITAFCSEFLNNYDSANIQRYYRYLDLKSKHPDAAVPPLDETLRKITEPDVELLSRNKSIIEEFRRSFELKENPKVTFNIHPLFKLDILEQSSDGGL